MSLSFHPCPNTHDAHLCWNFNDFKRMSEVDFDKRSLEERINQFTELMIFFYRNPSSLSENRDLLNKFFRHIPLECSVSSDFNRVIQTLQDLSINLDFITHMGRGDLIDTWRNQQDQIARQAEETRQASIALCQHHGFPEELAYLFDF